MDHITIALPASERGTPHGALIERLVEAINAANVPPSVALDALLSTYGSIVLSETKHMAAGLVCCNQLMADMLSRITTNSAEETVAAAVAAVAPSTPTAH